MKGLKIFNIILFSIICCIEVAVLYFLGSTLALYFQPDGLAAAFGIMTVLPLFIIFTAAIVVTSIILTITTKILVKKELAENLTKTKFDKICLLLPWLFIAINVIAFIVFLIIANKKS